MPQAREIENTSAFPPQSPGEDGIDEDFSRLLFVKQRPEQKSRAAREGQQHDENCPDSVDGSAHRQGRHAMNNGTRRAGEKFVFSKV
jgi:hypothetical protein